MTWKNRYLTNSWLSNSCHFYTRGKSWKLEWSSLPTLFHITFSLLPFCPFPDLYQIPPMISNRPLHQQNHVQSPYYTLIPWHLLSLCYTVTFDSLAQVRSYHSFFLWEVWLRHRGTLICVWNSFGDFHPPNCKGTQFLFQTWISSPSSNCSLFAMNFAAMASLLIVCHLVGSYCVVLILIIPPFFYFGVLSVNPWFKCL